MSLRCFILARSLLHHDERCALPQAAARCSQRHVSSAPRGPPRVVPTDSVASETFKYNPPRTPSFKKKHYLAHDPNFQSPELRFRFGQKEGDHFYERGLTADAKVVAAEAEQEYRLAEEAYRSLGGGALTAADAVRTEIDDKGSEWTVRRLAVPFNETYVPSTKARFVLRGQVGQLENRKLQGDAALQPEHIRQVAPMLVGERRILDVLESQRSVLEKAELAASLVGRVLEEHATLQPRTWTSLFEVWSQAQIAPLAHAYLKTEAERSQLLQISDTGAKKDMQPQAASMLSLIKYTELMQRCYFHMKATFCAPSAAVVEHLMAGVAISGRSDKKALHFATRLFLDADKYLVLPTRTTYAAYFDVCNHCEAMDLAVSRFADAIDRLYIEPDASMATALLRGLNENGLVEEAVALLARIEKIDVDVQLLNCSMETLLLSNDPRAVLAAFEAAGKHSHIAPSSETFTLLLLACERLSDWSPTVSILKELQVRKVRGSPQCLNLLLKGLLTLKLKQYAHQLFLTMKFKGVDVWPALEAAIPSVVREAARLSKRTQKKLLRRGTPLTLTKEMVLKAQQRLPAQTSSAAGLPHQPNVSPTKESSSSAEVHWVDLDAEVAHAETMQAAADDAKSSSEMRPSVRRRSFSGVRAPRRDTKFAH